jgi:Domain of unknown function (DUF5658)
MPSHANQISVRPLNESERRANYLAWLPETWPSWETLPVQRGVHDLMSALRLPSCKILVFTFLSLVDLALTLQLLATGNEAIYESNPAARWFFQHYGWAGLAVFKAGLVSLVLCLSMAISLHHPRAGRRILLFACAALVPVVVYNSALASHLTFCPEHAQDALARETWSRGLALTAEIQASREYGALVARLSADLAAGRSGLAEAAQALQSTERAQDPRWLALLHERYPGQSDETCRPPTW